MSSSSLARNLISDGRIECSPVFGILIVPVKRGLDELFAEGSTRQGQINPLDFEQTQALTWTKVLHSGAESMAKTGGFRIFQTARISRERARQNMKGT
jgi:hypothetical protein